MTHAIGINNNKIDKQQQKRQHPFAGVGMHSITDIFNAGNLKEKLQ